MGKIRIKTIGDETQEAEEKKTRLAARQESKKRKEDKKSTDHSLQTTAPEVPAVDGSPSTVDAEKKEVKKEKSAKKKPTKARVRSKKYQAVKVLTDPKKIYNLSEALELLPQLKISKFDETVELHVNTLEKGISGSVTLPHGTGKTTKVAVADEKTIADIEKGKIDFDILVAAPSMMPKLAKVAKFLGPRGLMPNPKNGTVTDKPEDVIKKFQGGHVNFKTESNAPVIHLTVGKLSFGKEKLSKNIQVALKAVSTDKIRNVTLKSTMSPGLKLNITSV